MSCPLGPDRFMKWRNAFTELSDFIRTSGIDAGKMDQTVIELTYDQLIWSYMFAVPTIDGAVELLSKKIGFHEFMTNPICKAIICDLLEQLKGYSLPDQVSTKTYDNITLYTAFCIFASIVTDGDDGIEKYKTHVMGNVSLEIGRAEYAIKHAQKQAL